MSNQPPVKKKPELIVIENDECKMKSTDNSLQGNFQSFRSYISEVIKIKKERKKVDRKDPEKMKALRQKFIEKAKSFLGVPYGKKYLIDHPDYNSDLFLDCCGLVRHVVNSLEDDFGFHLGKWNQGYQYDVLPKEITFDQLQPGDLIFYSGIFYPDRNLKRQPHSMTHVEIFLGEGEKTIGSRDSRGVVEIFDTFQFSSENYFNIQYHFKSIDTWLQGIHKSFCKYHKWYVNQSTYCDYKNPYSVFYEGDQEEEGEMNEEEEGENQDEDEEYYEEQC